MCIRQTINPTVASTVLAFSLLWFGYAYAESSRLFYTIAICDSPPRAIFLTDVELPSGNGSNVNGLGSVTWLLPGCKVPLVHLDQDVSALSNSLVAETILARVLNTMTLEFYANVIKVKKNKYAEALKLKTYFFADSNSNFIVDPGELSEPSDGGVIWHISAEDRTAQNWESITSQKDNYSILNYGQLGEYIDKNKKRLSIYLIKLTARLEGD